MVIADLKHRFRAIVRRMTDSRCQADCLTELSAVTDDELLIALIRRKPLTQRRQNLCSVGNPASMFQ